METIIVEVIGGVITLLLTALISWFSYQASRRDAQQQKQVDDLYDKHQKDADKLQQLEVKIAQDHYNKPELDRKLDAIEKSFKDGFADLGKKFDNLSNHLLEVLKK